jgi:NAD(P)-dependent dehydrogenase (short-subunit alcohol dehydrogenase family)
MDAQQLPGTAALVTGASRGFGQGIAIALSRAGANVTAWPVTAPGWRNCADCSVMASGP